MSPVAVEERPLAFECCGDRLLGILSRPAAPGRVGVVVIVGGPQYRAGSHRQFVHLARRIALAGHPCLRFDYRGMGDSEGALRSFETVSDDIAVAIDAFVAAEPTVERVVLWGLCDGASAALLYLDERPDPRIGGLVLMNPWVRTAASEAKTRVKHYYLQRLFEPAFWRKLADGGVGWSALRGLFGNLRAARRLGTEVAPNQAYPTRMAAAWQASRGPVLLMLSEHDYTAREFEEYTATDQHWRRALATHPPQTVRLADSDHTCSAPQARREAEEATVSWLASLGPTAP